MGNNILSSLIDWTLTPQNALNRGYRFIDDMFYDSQTPLPEVITLVKEERCKLGSPHSKTYDDPCCCGLYTPLKNNQ